MQIEFEAKFLDIDHDSLRSKLKALGAKLIEPERLMRRRNFDYPDKRLATTKSAWVRVRDEGGAVTMSYKQTNDYTVQGTEEINLAVDDFDTASDFLEALGLRQKSYQETKRESWLIDQVHVDLDTWPWIPPFVELEGPDEATIKLAAKKLGLDWSAHRAGDASVTYQQYYDVTTDEIVHTELIFGPVPTWFDKRKRKRRP